MHSSTNKVRVSNFHPDGTPTTLTNNIDDDTTAITLTSGANFTNFEGGAVGVGTSGYLLIDKEIISYNTVSGNTITIDGSDRGIDSSLKSNHAANALVYKYEFNGVSLRKINKEHDIDSREKTFDSYFIKVSDTDTDPSFVTTKSGGGSAVHVSQNIPFEAIDPQITSITPTGTNISARIKTTSGTSGSRTTGGGTWTTGSNCSQSFVNQSSDIEMDVTDIVNNHLGGSNNIPNYGFITKFSGSYEDDGTPINLKFFSRNTHTIYAPKLEVRWDDHAACSGSNTGSLTALTMSGEINNHIFIKGLQPTYRESEKVRFRMGCRKEYVQRTFTNSIHSSSFYVPEGSGSYSIIDVSTNTNIVPFSAYTSMSCDSTSMYFDQWLNTFESGRYYKVIFKLKYDDGQEHIIDNDEEFKVI